MALKNTIDGGSDVRDLISENLVAKVIASRKATFQERYDKRNDARGSKGKPQSLDRTRFMSHGGMGSRICEGIVSLSPGESEWTFREKKKKNDLPSARGQKVEMAARCIPTDEMSRPCYFR